MRIYQLVPGSGGTFYCQNCLRDYALVRALRRMGHDVVVVPLYLPPLGFEEENHRAAPVFFGGINVYLKQRFALFQKAPRWIDRIFDSTPFLKLAASCGGSTSAAELGPMTLSMLQGRLGKHKKEFHRLVEWMKEHARPDIVHISNALLLGLAPEIKEALKVPIVCSLQDEKPWLEEMPEPYRQQAWDAIKRNIAFTSALVATSKWYADCMAGLLSLPRESIDVVYPGIKVDGAGPAELNFQSPVIGFLSRLSKSQGLGTLVDAFLELKQQQRFNSLRLRATGGCTSSDRQFLEQLHARLRSENCQDDVDFDSGFNESQRLDFLRGLSVMSVPVPRGEAFGLHLLEAMALGIPVVQPSIGAYPEIIEATGGGMLYDAAKPGALAANIESLLTNPSAAKAIGRQGCAAVTEKFSMERMAADMTAIYGRICPGT